MADVFRQVPPQNFDAEKSVLGAIFRNNNALAEAFEIITTEDFYRESHREIAAAMLAMDERRAGIDEVTLGNELKARGALEQIGGRIYLSELQAFTPTAMFVSEYARIVRRMSQLRKVGSVCTEVASEAYEVPVEVDEFLGTAAEKVFDACFSEADKSAVQALPDILAAGMRGFRMAREHEELSGLTSQFVDLNRMVGGFEAGDLTYVAARPSMGKTAWAIDLARHWALNYKAVAFFSLEMNKKRIGQRLLCCQAQVNLMAARQGYISDESYGCLVAAEKELANCQIFIDETGGNTPLSLRNRCRIITRLLKGQTLDAIIVDYVQLMNPDSKERSEQEALTHISRALKNLGKEFECPVIALCQLNRDCEKRENKRPILPDLRASGALEQDADIILFLYRDEYYTREKSKEPGVVEVIVGKQRDGDMGTVKLTFNKQTMRFASYMPH